MSKGVYCHKPLSKEHKEKIGKAVRRTYREHPEIKKGKPTWSSLHKKEMSLIMKIKNRFGKRNPNWQGGKSRKKHCGIVYEFWTKKVFEYDNYTCWICEARNHKGLGATVSLEAHHLKSWAEYPKLRYVVGNGLTLCLECHRIYTKQGRKKRSNNF